MAKRSKRTEEGKRENPRTARVRQVILDAAIELLVERGAHEVTANRIAEETGVARTTIYRQWPDQASLLLATIDTVIAPSFDPSTTGDVMVDLRQTLINLRKRLKVRPIRPIFAALVTLASRDDGMVNAQQRFVSGLVQPTTDVLEVACERGALPANLDCAAATASLAGPLLHQSLIMRQPINDDLIDLLMAQFNSRFIDS